MTKEEIFNDILRYWSRSDILERAKRDNERPMGTLLTYIKDVYNLPKPQGWEIAERVINHYNIVN